MGDIQMNEEYITQLLRETGVLLEGHFKLTSGRHSPIFLQCSQVLQHPAHAERLGQALAKRFGNFGATTVVGPAMGGVLLAHETARALGVRSIYAEKEDGHMTFRRGFTITPGERMIVIEDAITTGGSAMDVVGLLRAAGAEVVGIGCLVDRTGGKLDLGLPLQRLLKLEVPSYDPQECPLCAAGKPLTEPKRAASR